MPNRRRFRVPSLSGSVHEREHSSFGSEAPELRLVECKTQSPQDREIRERLHAYRYLMFQHGETVREIAETEGVDERQIYLSISHCETRLPRAEVIANRNFRNAMVAQRRLAEKSVDTLDDLLQGKGGKNWHQRSKALEHFRRLVGAESGTGLSVQVTQQVGIVNSERPCSFEEVMDHVRQRLIAQQREQSQIVEAENAAEVDPVS